MLVLHIFTKPDRHPHSRPWRPYRTRQQRLTYHLGETLPSLAVEALQAYAQHELSIDEHDCVVVHSSLGPTISDIPPIWITMSLLQPQINWTAENAYLFCERFTKGVNHEILAWSGLIRTPPCAARVDVQLSSSRSLVINDRGVIVTRW